MSDKDFDDICLSSMLLKHKCSHIKTEYPHDWELLKAIWIYAPKHHTEELNKEFEYLRKAEQFYNDNPGQNINPTFLAKHFITTREK